MKQLLIFAILLFVVQLSAQIKAVTEKGDTIYVYSNGTWSYELEAVVPLVADEFSYLKQQITVDSLEELRTYVPTATKEVATDIGQFVFKYDNTKWTRIPVAQLNEEAEFAFQHKEKDMWGMILTEEIEVGKENMLKIARNNMESLTGAEAILSTVQNVNVNGTDVLEGVLEIDFSGIEFVYDVYFFSDHRGTTQIMTWTSNGLWKKYGAEMTSFLNGIVVKE